MWAARFFGEFNKVPSVYLEDIVDQDQELDIHPYKKHLLEEAAEAMKYEDRHRDHSMASINEDEKLEIEIFKTMKRD